MELMTETTLKVTALSGGDDEGDNDDDADNGVKSDYFY